MAWQLIILCMIRRLRFKLCGLFIVQLRDILVNYYHFFVVLEFLHVLNLLIFTFLSADQTRQKVRKILNFKSHLILL